LENSLANNKKRRRVFRAIVIILIFGAVGIIPLEFVIPLLVNEIGELLDVIFVLFCIYMTIYVLGGIWALYVILRHAGGEQRLESGWLGRWILMGLRRKTFMGNNDTTHWSYEIWYHFWMLVYGFLSGFIKIGVARCALYPRFSAISMLLLGGYVRVYFLVYHALDVVKAVLSGIKLLFGISS